MSDSAPTLTLNRSQIIDAGSPAVPYRYYPGKGLVEVGTDVDTEVAELYQAAASGTEVAVTIRGAYIAPARARFRLTKRDASDKIVLHGDAKEYAVLTISFAQRAALPVLNGKTLAWTNACSLVTGTQDVQSTELMGTTGDDTLENMPVIDGQGTLCVDFTTGIIGANFSDTLNGVFNAANAIDKNAQFKSLLPVAAAAFDTATGYLALAANMVSTLGSSPKFSVDIAGQAGFRVVAHSKTPNAAEDAALRIRYSAQGALTSFVFTPSQYCGDFQNMLDTLAGRGQTVKIDPFTRQLSVVDSGGKPVVMDASDPNNHDALSPFTYVVVEAGVTAAS